MIEHTLVLENADIPVLIVLSTKIKVSTTLKFAKPINSECNQWVEPLDLIRRVPRAESKLQTTVFRSKYT